MTRAKAFLFGVQALVGLSTLLVGLVTAAATYNSPLSERIPGAVFIAALWAGLHSGYVIAPFCYRRPRRKLAMFLMTPPVLVCVVSGAITVATVIPDVAGTRDAGEFVWALAFAVACSAFYLAPLLLMLAPEADAPIAR